MGQDVELGEEEKVLRILKRVEDSEKPQMSSRKTCVYGSYLRSRQRNRAEVKCLLSSSARSKARTFAVEDAYVELNAETVKRFWKDVT